MSKIKSFLSLHSVTCPQYKLLLNTKKPIHMDPVINTSRRSFLRGILALSAAPAIVKADSLMKIVVPMPEFLTLYGDGIHDDTRAFQQYLDMKPVFYKGEILRLEPFYVGGLPSRWINFPPGKFLTTDTIRIQSNPINTVFRGNDSHFIRGPFNKESPMFHILS